MLKNKDSFISNHLKKYTLKKTAFSFKIIYSPNPLFSFHWISISKAFRGVKINQLKQRFRNLDFKS